MTSDALYQMLKEFEKKFGKSVSEWTANETLEFINAKRSRTVISS